MGPTGTKMEGRHQRKKSIVSSKMGMIDPGLVNNVVILSEASQNQWQRGQNESLGKEKEMDFSFFLQHV